MTNGRYSGSATFSGPPPFAMQPVTGAAYSGEETTEFVQTLADGTHITRTMPGRKIFRDSLGRTRTERPLMMGPQPQAAHSPVVVEITDPVAGYQYTLDTENHVAHRFALPPAGTRPAMAPPPVRPAGAAMANAIIADPRMPPTAKAAAGGVIAMGGRGAGGPMAANDPTRPQFQSEQIGTQMIDGVLCEGRRTTTTFPVGSQGNDRPIVTTSETWMSPELKILVLSKNSDPRSGENTFKIANLSRLEPDPNLFQVPPDYTIVDEKGPFTITYTK